MYDKAFTKRIIEARKASEFEPKSKTNNNPELPEEINPGLAIRAVKRRKLEDYFENKEFDQNFDYLEQSLN